MATVKRQHPATGFLVVASESDPAVLLEAMRAGATEFLQEPITAAALEQAISRLVAHRASPGAAGEIYAFVGAKGGVGTTTTAVNVTTALAKVAPSKTVFVDLHLANGDAALLFGAEPRFSIVDALDNTHRFDEAFFRGLVTPTKVKADLLASSDRALVQHAGNQQFRAVVEFAAQLYRYVIRQPLTHSTSPRGSSSSPTRSCRPYAAPAGSLRRCASVTGATASWSS
jgi:pilus assembly protein CpaE